MTEIDLHNRRTVLIVDDDQRNIFALRATLHHKGYSVVTATNAEDAFKILAENKSIGIVLMDMMMPDIDGYEATVFIKSQPEWEGIKVIAVTARAMSHDKERCMQAGADEYLSKPIDVDKLLQTLQTHLI